MLLAVGIGPIGPIEGLIILLVVVLIFGVGKLSDLGGALGKSVREFRRAARQDDDDATPSQNASLDAGSSASAPSTAGRCGNCGAQLDAAKRFCSECGTPVQAAVN
jgi:sec-independent protein translocase protein TatA